jgi:hypothetical protein
VAKIFNHRGHKAHRERHRGFFRYFWIALEFFQNSGNDGKIFLPRRHDVFFFSVPSSVTSVSSVVKKMDTSLRWYDDKEKMTESTESTEKGTEGFLDISGLP